MWLLLSNLAYLDIMRLNSFTMCINLLLDNCILLRLISKVEISNDLLQLEFLVKEKHVVLLTPAVLKKEWAKHKEVKRVEILNELKDLGGNARRKQTIHDPGGSFLDEQIEDLKSILLTQLEILEELVSRYSVSPSADREVDVIISAQRRAERAPFHHRKKDNFNDAELLFSSINYLNKQGRKALYFVSDNTQEFGLGERPEVVLHPDIKEIFPGFDIHYFTDIRDTYKAFDSLGLPRRKRRQEHNQRRIQDLISIDRSKPILDQVHEYLDKRFRELIIIPKKMFTEHYPFITGRSFDFYRKPFTLITDNQEVFDLLIAIKFAGKKPLDEGRQFIKNEEDEKKVFEIFNCLLRNFLHHVAFKNDKETQLAFPESTTKCDCSLCLYKDLNFSRLLRKEQSIQDGSATIQAKMRVAYGFYKMRDFVTAAKMMQQLADETKEGKGLLYYIVNFNLKRLGSLIASAYWQESEIIEWGKELSGIDLNPIYKECRNTENYIILKWIHEKEFYQRTFTKMHELVSTIRDLYYGQNGGFNESTKKLLELYYSVDNFLNQNSLVYDIFSEYASITDLFIEGLMAAHNWNKTTGGRLSFFNDYIIEKIILSGNADSIRKFFYRYKLNVLSYHQNADNNTTFFDRFDHFLTDYNEFSTLYDQYIQVKNDAFWNNLSNVLCNHLTMLSLLDACNDRIDRFAQKLLSILSTEKHLHLHPLHKTLCHLLAKKGTHISPPILMGFLLLGLEQDTLHHNTDYFHSLEEIFEAAKLTFAFSEEEFSKVRNRFFVEHQEDTGQPAWVVLGIVYNSLSSETYKEEIRKYVYHSLLKHFNTYHYYMACMFFMIETSEDFNTLYFKEMNELVEKGQCPQFFSRQDYYSDAQIDQFLNFCFKYNLKVPVSIQPKLTQLSPYNQWLHDMEGFDYRDFKHEWLSHYFTKYYKQAYKRSNTLRRYLLDYLQKNKNNELERMFLLIYCYDE